MAGRDNAYSRIVAVTKIVLPLVALGLFSTLFLFARQTPQGEPIRFAEESVQDLARDQRLGNASYKAVTNEGTQVQVDALEFRPDPDQPKLVYGSDLEARLITPDGLTYTITAPSGEIDENAGLTVLSDQVEMQVSNGYVMESESVSIKTDLSFLKTLAPVTAEGPLGRIEAAYMEISTMPDTGLETRIVFGGGVRLLYNPDQGTETE